MRNIFVFKSRKSKQMKNKIFKALTTVFIGFLITSPLSYVKAESSVVTNSPNIDIANKVQSEGSNFSNSTSTNSKSNAQALSESAPGVVSKIKESTKQLAGENKDVAVGAGNTATKAGTLSVKGLQPGSTEFKDYTGTGITGIAERVDKSIDTIGGGILGLGIKFLYYAINVFTIVAFIGLVFSFFVKKMQTMKYIIALGSLLIALGAISYYIDINILDNPIVSFVKWIFSGN